MRSKSAGSRSQHSTPWGRRVAQLLCLVLGLIGALPLFAAMLLKNGRVQHWTNVTTENLIRKELGLEARYRATLLLWPLELRVEDLSVASNDGGPPALRVESLRLRPRVLSLLLGQLNLGEVQVTKPQVRAVIKDGKLANASLKLNQRPAPKRRRPQAEPPFTFLALTSGNLQLDLDGKRFEVQDLNVDVYAKRGPAFEVTLRTSRTLIDMQHHVDASKVSPAIDARDEDVLCGIDLQAHIGPKVARLRRMVVQGFADLDHRSNTRHRCDRPPVETDLQQISLKLTDFVAEWSTGTPRITGRVSARFPLAPVNRFVNMPPVQGWVALNTSVKWDRSLRLPELDGHLSGSGLQLERYRIADLLDADFAIDRDVVKIKKTNLLFAEGRTIVHEARIAPFEKDVPFAAGLVETHGMTFPGLMKSLGVTPKTIVAWNFGDGQITELKGLLAVPHIEGQLRTDTHGFEVFDNAFNDPARKHMIGVPKATVRGRIVVQPKAFEFRDTTATFGRSQLNAQLVSIGFDNDLDIIVNNSTALDLADISPIVNIPMAGKSRIGVRLAGKAGDPLLTGSLSVDDFNFGGFPLGSIKSAQVRFRPLVVDFSEVRASKGKSDYLVPIARLDFNQTGAIIADAQATSAKLDLRDFLAMWHFDRDPRYDSLSGWGRVNARVHYVLGGAEDRCGEGLLKITSQVSLSHLEMYEEQYDAADADVDFTWSDMRAGYMGVHLDIPSLTLRKGMGAIVGTVQVRPGAQLNAHAAATAIPIGRFNALGVAGRLIEGTVMGVADVTGTLDAPQVEARLGVSRLFIGRTRLGPSELTMNLVSPPRSAGMAVSQCKNPIAPPFDPAEYRADASTGTFHVDGQLFGGQIALQDVQITRQTRKHASGSVRMNKLDLALLNEFRQPAAARDITGSLSGDIVINDLPFADPASIRGAINGLTADLERGALKVTVGRMSEPITFESGRVDLANVDLNAKYGEISVSLGASAHVSKLSRTPELAAEVRLAPVDLSNFASLVPRAEAMSGKLRGQLKIAGPLDRLRTTGALQLASGELQLKGLDWPITNIELSVDVGDGELKIVNGEANLGMGKLQIAGGGPWANMQLGNLRFNINASDVPLPSDLGLKGSFNAKLEASVDPNAETVRPHITGMVTLDELEYDRPVQMTADVSTLAQRGKRSQVEVYDPENDKLDFDVFIYARSPLRINNELIEAELALDKAGLQLVGTNQRFGLRGLLQAKPSGRIHLRQHVFEIREGSVLFDDATRINPRVDLRATTEYRRYSSQGTAAAGSGAGVGTGAAADARSSLGGRWRITMHAHGNADELHIDLTSDPALSPDDVFMLLTVGVTRTEVNQAQSASMVSSVALEALGTLSGADRTVRNTIPLIDDFRFGSAYSARTGRTEPTVTIGKRLAERIRATVTSGLAESREVRSNVEWQLNRRLSVEGSYDNVNDISSSQLGNLGADIRWRLEFR